MAKNFLFDSDIFWSVWIKEKHKNTCLSRIKERFTKSFSVKRCLMVASTISILVSGSAELFSFKSALIKTVSAKSKNLHLMFLTVLGKTFFPHYAWESEQDNEKLIQY